MSDEIETIDKNPKSWSAWRREAERLQEIIDGMALAAMDSEPVAWQYRVSAGPATGWSLWHDGKGEQYENSYKVERRPLYRHAQQPVVPKIATADDFGGLSIAKAYGWNACRAAMLAAAPHDTHALNSLQSVDSVADRWIPVSERMPDVGVKVLCFPVKDEPIHATFNGQLWLQDVSWSGSDDTIDNVIPVSVTHWMPLPAAPQEVKGE